MVSMFDPAFPRVVVLLAAGLLAGSPAPGREIDVREAVETELLEQTRRLFWSGQYADCAALCESGITAGRDYGFLRDLFFRSLIAEGHDALAYENFKALRERNPQDLPLLMTGHRICADLGKSGEATEILADVNRLAQGRERTALSADDLVALGTAAFALGADPAKVLKNYFHEARKKEELYPSSYLAAGALALEKRDFAAAADEFRAGAKAYPGDPDMHFGLAAAFFPSNRPLAGELIEKALSINPRHTGAMCLAAEHLIDAEQHAEAGEVLSKIIEVNPHHAEAWALSAVIAIFENDAAEAARCRDQALAVRERNPRVDYIIGESISRKRRFAEGAEYQRAALAIDPGCLPAMIQLALDLLRLGREDEAWELVEKVHASDAYHVVAFNLANLRDQMKKMATLANDDFVIRMTQDEAFVYGDRALEILGEAKRVLCAKYGIRIDEPVLVEFFPSQQDFAVRTLGVPGGGGLLGVCFGSVITMNSPGGLTHGMNNWEATLWHEFCHVVTLTKTRNRMPRWLSEGISVYEEWLRDPAWGQHMTPRYRELILEEEILRPVSEISDMFMSPASAEELMFAYFESALVVEFLVERYGIGKLLGALADLGRGVSFEEASANHFLAADQLDGEFEAYALERAAALGPEVDWSRPEPGDLLNAAAAAAFLEKNPKNYHAMKAHAALLLEEERWEEAARRGEKLRRLFPGDRESGNAYVLLAKAYRELGLTGEERAVLRELAALSADATPAMLRLLDLEAREGRWADAGEWALGVIAVNPLLERPHYHVGRAREEGGDAQGAIEAYQRVLRLGAEKPAEVHYRLARLLRERDPEAARRHVLDALAEAPRYRDAQRLLVELVEARRAEAEPASEAAPGVGRARPASPNLERSR